MKRALLGFLMPVIITIWSMGYNISLLSLQFWILIVPCTILTALFTI